MFKNLVCKFINALIRLSRWKYHKNACDAESISLVGHSIGGIVARAAPIIEHLSPYWSLSKESFDEIYNVKIDAIVTLATPHHSLPYAFDLSVSQFYESVNQWWMRCDSNDSECSQHPRIKGIPVVSISGGLRDELVQPNLCHVEPFHPNSISVCITTQF